MPHSSNFPVPEVTIDTEPTSVSQSSAAAEHDSYMPEAEVQQRNPLTQAQLDDLTRDLNLSKESTQLLGSHLRENDLLG